MNSNRVTTMLAAIAVSAMALAGCSAEEEERIAEPELDFPYTSTTAMPTLEFDFDDEDDEDLDEDEDETETSESETSSTSSRSSSSRSASRSRNDEPTSRREVEPAPAPAPQQTEPGSACAWPNQADANGREFATFCDREWARTVLDGQQYFWQARGAGWVSVDPEGTLDNEVCWDRDDFEKAPEAIRNAAVFCEPAATPTPATE